MGLSMFPRAFLCPAGLRVCFLGPVLWLLMLGLMVLYQVLKITGQQDDLAGEGLAAKPGDPGLILRTYMVEGEIQLP